MRKQILFFILFICSVQFIWSQYDIPKKPDFQTSVYDYYKLFDASQKKYLEDKLVRYSDSTSTQIVLITIASSKGEDLPVLGAKWGHKWGIGQAKEDNGILILLAKEDRRIDISTGYGIEYRMTNRMTEQIINRVIIPQFKKGEFYNGLNAGTDAIFDALNGEFKGSRQSNSSSNEGFPIAFVILLFIIFFIIMISLSKRKGGGNHDSFGGGKRQEGLSPLDIIILSRAGRSSGSFGSGSFGGGGFSGGGGFGGGFGGGGFGGGGAGGSW